MKVLVMPITDYLIIANIVKRQFSTIRSPPCCDDCDTKKRIRRLKIFLNTTDDAEDFIDKSPDYIDSRNMFVVFRAIYDDEIAHSYLEYIEKLVEQGQTTEGEYLRLSQMITRTREIRKEMGSHLECQNVFYDKHTKTVFLHYICECKVNTKGLLEIGQREEA